jgi:hypothetical protein
VPAWFAGSGSSPPVTVTLSYPIHDYPIVALYIPIPDDDDHPRACLLTVDRRLATDECHRGSEDYWGYPPWLFNG